MGDFRDFKVSPSELQDVQFYRFRKRGYGKLIEYIRLVLPSGEEVFLHDVTSKNQFVSRLGLKISEVRSVRDYNERNNLILDACRKRVEPVVIRSVNSDGRWFGYAVVTEKFTEVKHYELWRLVENELAEQGISVLETSEFRTNRRVWKTYIFENQVGRNVGDIVQVGLRVCNSIKGTSSIIFYPFWKRLVCSNGMTSSKGIWRPATIHRGNKIDILASVRNTLREALEQAIGFETLMLKAIQIKLSPDEKLRVVEAIAKRKRLSQYVHYYITEYAKREQNNLWGVANAITYVATHKVDAVSTKIALEQIAHSLLRGGQKQLKELLAPSKQTGGAENVVRQA